MPKTERCKILVVDDDENIAEAIKITLEDNDYEAIVANSGKECLEKLKAVKPDLILLDVMMPGMSGMRLLQELKKDKRTRGIPVAMLTGVKAEFDEGMKEEGIEDYIVKPFDPNDLIARIKRILKG